VFQKSKNLPISGIREKCPSNMVYLLSSFFLKKASDSQSHKIHFKLMITGGDKKCGERTT
jgi:hypothetical protein